MPVFSVGQHSNTARNLIRCVFAGTVCPSLMSAYCHSSLITEVRQPPSFCLSSSPPPTLPFPALHSLSLISSLSITFLPLINARGMCGQSCVFRCVFASVQLRLWTCYRVYCVLVWQARVCVCAYHTGHALISHAVLSLN